MCKSGVILFTRSFDKLSYLAYGYDRLHIILVNANALPISFWHTKIFSIRVQAHIFPKKTHAITDSNQYMNARAHKRVYRCISKYAIDALEHLHFNKNALVIMYNFVFIARFNMDCAPLHFF